MLAGLISEFSKIVGYVFSIQKSIIFLHTSHRPLENKILKYHFQYQQKKIYIVTNLINQICENLHNTISLTGTSFWG